MVHAFAQGGSLVRLARLASARNRAQVMACAWMVLVHVEKASRERTVRHLFVRPKALKMSVLAMEPVY